MNKGLFIHLVATFIVIVMAIFIVGSEDWDMQARGITVFAVVVVNLFCLLCFCDPVEWHKSAYNKKIKL